MPRCGEYSVEEVMSLTVEDIQDPDFVDVQVHGWQQLTPEQREGCMLKLRGLVRERDENAQSITVDATELEERLRQVQRSPSCSPTPPIDLEAEEREKLESERRSSNALIDAHGRPCYPIELAPEVYENPGQYKAIISYWKRSRLFQRCSPITKQLQQWNKFRQSQLKIRRHYLSQHKFPEFQQKVLDRRRKHGLDGDVQLLEDRDEQGSLDHWMEYQDSELQKYESLEIDLEKAQAALISIRQTMAEAGLSTYEGIQEPELGGYPMLSRAHDGEEDPAQDKRTIAKGKLQLAESRLKAAESDEMGDTVERGTWIRCFQEQVEAAQIRLDAVPEYCNANWIPGGKYYVQKGKNDRERAEKTREAFSKRYEDTRNAERALRLAKEGLEMARSDGFGERVERAALVKMAQEEVQSARVQFEEEDKSKDKDILERKVLGALGWIVATKLKMETHRVLLEWIEQQRCEIANGCASIENGDHGRAKRAGSRALRVRPTTGTSVPTDSSQAKGRKGRRLAEGSVLKPVHASKVTKPPRKRQNPRQNTKVPGSAPQPVDKATTDLDTPESRGNKALKRKDSISAPLRSVRSSRIAKPSRKRSTGRRRDGAKLLKENDLATSSTSRNTTQPSENRPLRRSTRISKQPERYHPG